MNDVELKELFRLKRLGWPTKDLSEKFGVSDYVVNYYCRVNGVKPKEYHPKLERNLPKEHNYSHYLRQAGLIHRRQGDVPSL